MRRIFASAIAAVCLSPVALQAEVIRFDIVERAPAFAGRSFGDVGPYERITARATIGNAKFSLLPGQYVRVRLHIRQQPDALMVPQVALGSSQLGKYVYVVGKGNTVDQRIVSLGATSGDLVAVLSGVAEGDQVITGNLQKIGPGMPISPLPQEKPAS
jgi:multidrug efflux pump subunit AcrA (membrane-fusion protein)